MDVGTQYDLPVLSGELSFNDLLGHGPIFAAFHAAFLDVTVRNSEVSRGQADNTLRQVSKSWFRFSNMHRCGRLYELFIEGHTEGADLIYWQAQEFFEKAKLAPFATHVTLVQQDSLVVVSEPGDENELPFNLWYPMLRFLIPELRELRLQTNDELHMESSYQLWKSALATFKYLDEDYYLSLTSLFDIGEPAPFFRGLQIPESMHTCIWDSLCFCKNLKELHVEYISLSPVALWEYVCYLHQSRETHRPHSSDVPDPKRIYFGLRNTSGVRVRLVGYGWASHAKRFCKEMLCDDPACAKRQRDRWDQYQRLFKSAWEVWDATAWDDTPPNTPDATPPPPEFECVPPEFECVKAHFTWTLRVEDRLKLGGLGGPNYRADYHKLPDWRRMEVTLKGIQT